MRLRISGPIAHRGSDGLISLRAGFASIAYGATAARKSLPLAAQKKQEPSFLARSKKVPRLRLFPRRRAGRKLAASGELIRP